MKYFILYTYIILYFVFKKLKSDIVIIERSKDENIVLCTSILTLRDFKKKTIVRGRTSIRDG